MIGGIVLLGRYVFVGRIAARQQWAYRGELLMRSVSMVLFMGVFMALWSTAFAIREGGKLVGYSLTEMVWYLAMTETVALSTSRVFIEISEAVKSGDLTYTLMRPVSYPFFQVANSLGNAVPRFALNLLTASAVVALGVGWNVGNLAGFLAFLGTAALALILDALIAVLIGLTAFWLEEVMPVFWIYQKLLFTVGGLFLPLEFFPGWLRAVSAWLPFRFVTNVPARAFVAFNQAEVLQSVVGQIIYILIFTGLVSWVWHIAQRRMVVHGG
ncbi:MAG: ABC-2 family transporter protein [Anaerolineae bacterium]|nr:ABC-2 family transporter protein [Anaerolineae bacterium]